MMINSAPVAGTVRGVVHPRVAELLSRQQYEQRTPEWYEVRKGLMTASDAAGALGIPAFNGQRNVRDGLLRQKVSGTFTGNHMTRWGQNNEDQVRERAMKALGEAAWDVGLVVHPELHWLGASPDGVTSSGKLIEIKCPYKRVPNPQEVPHHYWPQIQVQLECANIDQCYFVQWQPAHLSPDDTERFTIATVERDRAWFAEHVDELKAFWKDLMDLRKHYVPPPPPKCEIDPELYTYPVAPESEYETSDSESESDDDSAGIVADAPACKRRIIIDDTDTSGGEDTSGGDDDEELEKILVKAVDILRRRRRQRRRVVS